MEINMKKLKEELKEIVRAAGYNEAELFEKKKEILNEFIEEKIAEEKLPTDFDCSYFELHELYKIIE